jgi:hypothetical protein
LWIGAPLENALAEAGIRTEVEMDCSVKLRKRAWLREKLKIRDDAFSGYSLAAGRYFFGKADVRGTAPFQWEQSVTEL